MTSGREAEAGTGSSSAAGRMQEQIRGCSDGSNPESAGNEGVSSNNKNVLPERRMRMTSGPEGKLVFYTFPQLKMIIILSVVCCRQNHSFKMCLRQNLISRCAAHKATFFKVCCIQISLF